MQDAGSGPNKLAPAFSPALAVQKHGSGPGARLAARRRGQRPVVARDPEGLRPALHRAGRLRRHGRRRTSSRASRSCSTAACRCSASPPRSTTCSSRSSSRRTPRSSTRARWAVDLAGLARQRRPRRHHAAPAGCASSATATASSTSACCSRRFAVYGLSVYGGYGTAVRRRRAVRRVLRVRRGQRADRRAAGVLPHRHRRRLRHQPRPRRSRATCRRSTSSRSSRRSTRPRSRARTRWPSSRGCATYFPMRRGRVLVRRRASASPASRSSTASRWSRSRSATGSRSRCSASPAWRCRGRSSRSCRSSSASSRASRPAKACCGSRRSSPTTRGSCTSRCASPAASRSSPGSPGRTAGQFVLTLGGYHPNFHRDGYPMCRGSASSWQVSDAIVDQGRVLLRADVRSADGRRRARGLGRLRARRGRSSSFGANGIVYFDPFRFEVERLRARSRPASPSTSGSARSRSRSRSARRIRVIGPGVPRLGDLRGRPGRAHRRVRRRRASPDDSRSRWADFVRKYLEEAAPGVARVLTAITGKGALPPGTGPGGAHRHRHRRRLGREAVRGLQRVRDHGHHARCRRPTRAHRRAWTTTARRAARSASRRWTSRRRTRCCALALRRGRRRRQASATLIARRAGPGAFPLGVWGPPQPDDDRKVPKGDVIEAIDGRALRGRGRARRHAADGDRLQPGRAGTAASRCRSSPTRPSVPRVLVGRGRDAVAPAARRATATPTYVRQGASRGSPRAAPAARRSPRSRGERVGAAAARLADAGACRARAATTARSKPAEPAEPPPSTRAVQGAARHRDPRARRPRRERPRLSDHGDAIVRRRASPRRRSTPCRRRCGAAIAATLVRVPARGAPRTRHPCCRAERCRSRAVARGATAAVAMRGAATDGAARLSALIARAGGADARGARPGSRRCAPGEIAVLQLPNARRDVDPARARPRLDRQRRRGAHRRAGARRRSVLLRRRRARRGVPVPRGTERDRASRSASRRGHVRACRLARRARSSPTSAGPSALAAGVVLQAEGGRVRTQRAALQRRMDRRPPSSSTAPRSCTRASRSRCRASRSCSTIASATTAPREIALTLQHGARSTRRRTVSRSRRGRDAATAGAGLRGGARDTGAAATESSSSIARQRGVHLVGDLRRSPAAGRGRRRARSRGCAARRAADVRSSTTTARTRSRWAGPEARAPKEEIAEHADAADTSSCTAAPCRRCPPATTCWRATQEVAPAAPTDAARRATCASPRRATALPPDQILSTFPPANAEGAFESRLPQIVLRAPHAAVGARQPTPATARSRGSRSS